jgi:hypothetical protein
MAQLRDAIHTALMEAIPERDEAPWILQVYVQNIPSLTALQRGSGPTTSSPKRAAAPSPATLHQTFADHLAPISRPGGGVSRITTNPLLARQVVKFTKVSRKRGAWFWITTQNLAPSPPFTFDSMRRGRLKCELDVDYARLCGHSRDELRYILDPADFMGPDYPSRDLSSAQRTRFGVSASAAPSVSCSRPSIPELRSGHSAQTRLLNTANICRCAETIYVCVF